MPAALLSSPSCCRCTLHTCACCPPSRLPTHPLSAAAPLPPSHVPQLRSKQGKAVVGGMEEGMLWGSVFKA